MLQFDTVVMSGGSVRGAAHVGALRVLEDHGTLAGVRNFVGTSCGAIVCLLAALGLTTADMQARIERFASAEESDDAVAARVESVLTLHESLGIDDGSALCAWLRDAVSSALGAPKATFIELAKRTGRNLVIIGADLTTRSSARFCVDATPSMDVVDAVRISTSVPLAFRPVFYEGHVYVDGGLLDNFPLEHARTLCHVQRALGIAIRSRVRPLTPETATLPRYLDALLRCLIDKEPAAAAAADEQTVTIEFDDDGEEGVGCMGYDVECMRITLDAGKVSALVLKGHDAASRALGPP